MVYFNDTGVVKSICNNSHDIIVYRTQNFIGVIFSSFRLAGTVELKETDHSDDVTKVCSNIQLLGA